VLALVISTVAAGQQPCSMPSLAPPREPNILTVPQAERLGDLVMQRVRGDFALVGDVSLNQYVQKIADRMAQISEAGAVRVELIDIPEVNGVTLPGGRVLLARKLDLTAHIWPVSRRTATCA
jgi:predicted Zn-dependent protease